MTELEILMMKVPGLAELEAKEAIKVLNGLDDLAPVKLEKIKLMFVEKIGLSKNQCDDVVEVLMQTQSAQ